MSLPKVTAQRNKADFHTLCNKLRYTHARLLPRKEPEETLIILNYSYFSNALNFAHSNDFGKIWNETYQTKLQNTIILLCIQMVDFFTF